MLLAWLALIGAVFGARALRGWVQRQRRLLVAIGYPRRTVDVPRGWSVLEASRGFGTPPVDVRRPGRCSTCRVRVVEGAADLPPPSAHERRTLERIGAGMDARLACQL